MYISVRNSEQSVVVVNRPKYKRENFERAKKVPTIIVFVEEVIRNEHFDGPIHRPPRYLSRLSDVSID